MPPSGGWFPANFSRSRKDWFRLVPLPKHQYLLSLPWSQTTLRLPPVKHRWRADRAICRTAFRAYTHTVRRAPTRSSYRRLTAIAAAASLSNMPVFRAFWRCIILYRIPAHSMLDKRRVLVLGMTPLVPLIYAGLRTRATCEPFAYALPVACPLAVRTVLRY